MVSEDLLESSWPWIKMEAEHWNSMTLDGDLKIMVFPSTTKKLRNFSVISTKTKTEASILMNL